MALLSPQIKQRFFDTNGEPLVGGKLFSYVAGTTTPQATYTDSAGLTPNANPIILNSSGECDVWLLSASYKFVLKTSADVTLWTVDNVLPYAAAPAGSITTSQLADLAVTNAKIQNLTITTEKLADLSVTTAKIADLSVTTGKLAANSVTTAKLERSTTGFVLTAKGAGANPAWETPSAVNNNLIINGAMNNWQRNTTFSPGSGATYTADRFAINRSASGTVSVDRSTNNPTITQANYPIIYSHLTTIGTASSNAAGDYLFVEQKIEGVNIGEFISSSFTFSFWAYCSTTATLAVRFSNTVSNLSYVSNFTMNAANTWEKKTINVSVPTSFVDFSYDTGIGLSVGISLGAGTTFQTSTLNAWQTGNFVGSTTQTQLYTTAAATFRTTAWKIERGDVATAFLPFGRTYAADLLACFRYYISNAFWVVSTAWSGTSTAATSYFATGVTFPVLMRATPTLVLTNQSNTQFAAATGETDITVAGYREARTSTGSAANAGYRSSFSSANAEL